MVKCRGTNCAAAVCIIGILLVMAGIAAYFGLSISLNNQLHRALSISSAKHVLYDAYVDSRDEDARPPNYTMYLYNMTNSDAVRFNGSTPVYDLVGPYTWTKHKKRLDVSFAEGGTVVSYTDFTYYILNSDSNASLTAPVVNYNIGYLRVAGRSEANVLGAMSFVQMKADVSGEATTSDWIDRYIYRGGAGFPLNTAQALEIIGGVDFPNGTVRHPNPSTGLSNLGAFLTLAAELGTVLASGNQTRIAAVLNTFDERWPTFSRLICIATASGRCLASNYICPSGLSTSCPTVFAAQVNAVATYMQGAAGRYYAVYTNPATPETSGGVIITRTAQQWAFGFTDKLLVDLASMDPAVTPAKAATDTAIAYIGNSTSEEDVLKRGWREEFYTGKYNKSLIGEYIKFRSEGQIRQFPEPVTVRGVTGGVARMNLKVNDSVDVFVTQLRRPLRTIRKAELVDVKKIPCAEYRLDPLELGPKPQYLNDYKGVMNVSVFYSSMPLAITKHKFLDTDPVLNLTKLYNLNASAELDDTVAYIEPLLGRSLNATLKLQLNAMIHHNAFNLFNKRTFPMNHVPGTFNTSVPVIIPLVTLDEHGLITDKDADNLSKVLNGIRLAPSIVAAVLVILGGIMMLSGGCCCYVARKNHLSRKEMPTLELDELEKADR